MRLRSSRRLKVNPLRYILFKVFDRIIALRSSKARIRAQRSDMEQRATALKIIDINHIRRIVDRLRENHLCQTGTVLEHGITDLLKINFLALCTSRQVKHTAHRGSAEIRTALKSMVIDCRDTAGHCKAAQ